MTDSEGRAHPYARPIPSTSHLHGADAVSVRRRWDEAEVRRIRKRATRELDALLGVTKPAIDTVEFFRYDAREIGMLCGGGCTCEVAA